MTGTQARLRASAGAQQFQRGRAAEGAPEQAERRHAMTDAVPMSGLLRQRPFVLFWLARLRDRPTNQG